MAGNSELLKWPPLVTKRTCEWCSSPCWMKDEFPRLCQHPWWQWPTDLLLDLQHCDDCVVEYHRIRDDYVNTQPQRKKDLWEGDVQRLTLWINTALKSTQQAGETASHSTLELLDNFERTHFSMDDVVQNLNIPLLEILQFPQLLFNTSFSELFVNAMTLLIDNGAPLIPLEKYPGIYVLLVHPSQKIRKWANKAIQRLTRISSDDYDMIKDAIQWIVGVITLNMFDNDILLMESLHVSSSAVCLPSHLCNLKSPLEFWKGLTKLLLKLEGDVLCYKVLGVSGHHRNLPDSILSTIEKKGPTSLFWTAFTCLVIILERCGPRIWPMVTKQPLQVFNIITTHTIYCEELNRYKHGGRAQDTSRQTDEHIEQGGSQDSTTGDVQRGPTNAAIGWFQPFVLSVLDYGEVTVDCVTEVIRFLDRLSGETRNREIIVKLCNIVYRIVQSGRMSSLLPTADTWVMHLVKLSTLESKNQEVFRTIVLPAREIIVKLLTKTEERDDLSDISSLDFIKLKSDAERQDLAARLLDHLKKIPAKCKNVLHTKRKNFSLSRKVKRPFVSSGPQTTSEGTQTTGNCRENLPLYKKSAEKDYELKLLRISLVDYKNKASNVSPRKRERTSSSCQTQMPATSCGTEHEIASSKTRTPSSKIDKTVSAQNALTSKTSALAISGLSKLDPITVDSDEDTDESKTDKEEQGKKAENVKETQNIKQENQEYSNSVPGDLPRSMSESPGSQPLSLFKLLSQEKSRKHLNRLELKKDASRLRDSSGSSKDAQRNIFPSSTTGSSSNVSSSASNLSTGNRTLFSSTNNNVFENRSRLWDSAESSKDDLRDIASSSSVKRNILSSADKTSNDNVFSSSGSEDDARLIRKDKKQNRKLKTRRKKTGSSDETVSLEDWNVEDESFRKKEKKFRKKRSSSRINRLLKSESSETESLEELRKNSTSESEVDSDEPLKKLFSPKKKVKAAPKSPKSSTLEHHTQATTAENKNCALNSAGRINLDRKQLRKRIVNLKELLKDTKTKKISIFPIEVPKNTENCTEVNPLDAESPIGFDDFKVESQETTDERVPRIHEAGQLKNFLTNGSEFAESNSDRNAGNASMEFPNIKCEDGDFIDGKMTSECKQKNSEVPANRIESSRICEYESTNCRSTSEGYITEIEARDKDVSLHKTSSKDDDGSTVACANKSKNDTNDFDEGSLNEISKELENDGEFNENEWFDYYDDDHFLFHEEERDKNKEENVSIDEIKEEDLKSEEYLSDEELFASNDKKQLNNCEMKESNEEKRCSVMANADKADAIADELTNEQLYVAFNTENLDIKEEVENRKETKGYNLDTSPSLEISFSNKENKSHFVEELRPGLIKREGGKDSENEKQCVYNKGDIERRATESESVLSQDSTSGSDGRIANIIAEMDRKYGDISDSDEEEAEEEETEKKVEENVLQDAEDLSEMKNLNVFEDIDNQDYWNDDWGDTSILCSQESVIDAIEADTESLSSDEEQINENQDPFTSPEVVKLIKNLDTNNLPPAQLIPITQPTVIQPHLPTVNSLVPSRAVLPPASESAAPRVFQEKPAIVGPDPTFRPDAMVEKMLSWRVSWLDARRQDVEIYSNLERMEKLPKTFDSMASYCRSFAPILAVEAWEQAIKEWKECTKKIINTFVLNAVPSRRYMLITATKKNVKQTALMNRDLPEESQLVILKCEGFRIFGIVDKVEQEVARGRGSSSSDGGDGHNEKLFDVRFVIRVLRKTNFRPPESSELEITVVASLLTTLRRWCGLVNFHQSLLARDILRPRGPMYFCYGEIPKQVKPSELYNESQAKVIQTAADAVHQAYALPRICLVQGPPGTGKSHTIVGIVTSILNHPKAQETSQATSELFSDKPKILLCAPSNEAIDELIRKFIQAIPRRENVESNKENRRATERERNTRGEGFVNCGDFCLVRVGRKSKISDSVKNMSLEGMTRREMEKQNAGQEVNTSSNIKDQLKLLEKRIDAVERSKYILMKEETATATEENVKETKLQEFERDKTNLIHKKKDLERYYRTQREKEFKQKRMESRIRKDILNSADIICTTLSGSGSTSLLNDMRGTNGKKIPFSCVIVDEACQCCELDVLIPLQYHSTKLILVGDPEQLSATVISRDAKHLLYGRSMFDRLYRGFKRMQRNERPVHLLSIQYRMHPEIAYFPSKHFYNDNIHSHSSLLKRDFPVKFPYALFDVYRGRETNDNGGSISNTKEADMVSFICRYLIGTLRLQASDIGIITPYRTQRGKLQALLSNGFCRDIEVKTVDGFQGGQKNVIIMSCVRTGGNIGFLEDPNRLNVALTRARHALYVFGHMDTLKNFKGWGDMLKDADVRKLVFSVDTAQDVIDFISQATRTSVNHPISNGLRSSSPVLPLSNSDTPTPVNEENLHMNKRRRSMSSTEPSPVCGESSTKYRRTQSSEATCPVSSELHTICSRYSHKGPELRSFEAQQLDKDKDLLVNKTHYNNDGDELASCEKMSEIRNMDRIRREQAVAKEASNVTGIRQGETAETNEVEFNAMDQGMDSTMSHAVGDAAFPSRMDSNQGGNQVSLLDRLRQKFKDPSRECSTSTGHPSNLVGAESSSSNNSVDKANTTKPLKSNLKRPFSDEDTGATRPAKPLRFGCVEIFREQGPHQRFPIPVEEKCASRSHLQKCQELVKRTPCGSLSKSMDKTVSQAKHTSRHPEKGSNQSSHSKKDQNSINNESHRRVASSHTGTSNAQTNPGRTSSGSIKDKGNARYQSSHSGKDQNSINNESHRKMASSHTGTGDAQTNPGRTSSGSIKDKGNTRERNKGTSSSKHKEVPSELDKGCGPSSRSRTSQRESRSGDLGRASLSSGSEAVKERQLSETVRRVCAGQPVQRRPLVIEAPAGSRGGRAGRVHMPVHVASENNTNEEASQDATPSLRNWKPYGGPRNRTAQSNSSSVQSIRSRAVQLPSIENVQQRRQKRAPSWRDDLFTSKRRRK